MKNLWVGNQPDPNDRLKLGVSDLDFARVDALPKNTTATATVTDMLTGKQFVIRRDDCGADCLCALALVTA